MNHTFNKQHSNPVSFDLLLNSAKESYQKKSSLNPHPNLIRKQGIISNSKCHKQTNTIFNSYNNFPSLTKCHSTAKLTKTQNNYNYNNNNSHASSKSLASFPPERQCSPSPSPSPQTNNQSKNCNNEKSFSTTQSTDERKELNRLRSELKEKTDLINSLHNTIDAYHNEKSTMAKEICNIQMKLSELMQENNRLKEENMVLRESNERIHCENSKLQTKEIKLSEIISILNKDEISVIRDNESDSGSMGMSNYYEEEESLSGICFPDKINAGKMVQANMSNIPALNFGSIYDEKDDRDEENGVNNNNDNANCGNNKNQSIPLKGISKVNHKRVIIQQQQKQFKKINQITSNLIKKNGSIINKINK